MMEREKDIFYFLSSSSFFLLIFLFGFVCFCGKDGKVGDVEKKGGDARLIFKVEDGFILKDGWKILLRGVNIAHTAKRSKIPWVGEEELRVLREKFGLNFVRLTIFWYAIEPERDKIDWNYLQEMKNFIKMCERYGIYVLVDMHEALFGYFATHDNEGGGMPEWTRKKDCPPFEDITPWMLNFITPGVICQYDNFWRSEELQKEFSDVWKIVAEFLGEGENVVGFDIINEPWPGSIWNSVEKTKEWEEKYLLPFYEKVIRSIRGVSRKIVFYESHPLSDFGWPVFLPKPKDDNVVYAPHIYSINQFGLPGVDVEDIFKMHFNYAREQGVPMVVGEYGIEWFSENAYDYIKKSIDIFDENFVGSAIWSYDKSNAYVLGIVDEFLNPLTNFIPVLRPFPELVSGNVNIKFENENLRLSGKADVVLSCPEISPCYIDGQKITGNHKIKVDGEITIFFSYEGKRW